MRALVITLLVSLAAPAFAQPAPDRMQERREKIKQRIRALRAYALTEQLDLDPTTAGKLFPLLSKFDDEFDKLLLARADIMRRLQAADPRAIDKVIDEAVANQRALWDTEEKRLVQLRKILTPAQTARVLIVLPAMERKIQNQLRKAVQQKPPEDPFVDDDEDQPPRKRKRADRQLRNRFPQEATPQRPCDPFSDVHGCSK